jgi:hypothetical protein
VLLLLLLLLLWKVLLLVVLLVVVVVEEGVEEADEDEDGDEEKERFSEEVAVVLGGAMVMAWRKRSKFLRSASALLAHATRSRRHFTAPSLTFDPSSPCGNSEARTAFMSTTD